MKNKKLFISLGASLLFAVLAGGAFLYFNQPKTNKGTIEKPKTEQKSKNEDFNLKGERVEGQDLHAYYVKDDLSLEKKTYKVQSESIEKVIQGYIEKDLLAKDVDVKMEIYDDEDGKHARLSISHLNFIDYYKAHPKISEQHPAISLAGEQEDIVPATVKKLFAEAIDKTIKESFSIQYVHFTIGDKLEPNDGILFGEIPSKSQEILNKGQEDGFVHTDSYFEDPNTENGQLEQGSNSSQSADDLAALNEEVERLKEKYPDGNIPPDELPW